MGLLDNCDFLAARDPDCTFANSKEGTHDNDTFTLYVKRQGQVVESVYPVNLANVPNSTNIVLAICGTHDGFLTCRCFKKANRCFSNEGR